MDVFVAPSPTQAQLHERLYRNQQVLTALQPNRRTGSLKQLLKSLSERVRGDKEVITVFAKVRERAPALTDGIPVQPWLRKYQQALDLAIGTLKEIEKELEIIPRVESPMQLSSRDSAPSSGEETPQTVPSYVRPRSLSYEYERAAFHRYSVVSIGGGSEHEEKMLTKTSSPPRRNLSVPHPHRPRSASPHKLLRITNSGATPTMAMMMTAAAGGGGGGGGGYVATTGSMKSVCSIESGPAMENSSSVHDLNQASPELPPSLPFTRVQSLKSPHSVQVLAGKRKNKRIPNSYTNLTSLAAATPLPSGGGAGQGQGQGQGSSATAAVTATTPTSALGGNGHGKKHRRSLHKSSSAELDVQWDCRQVNGSDGMTTDPYILQQLLDRANKELAATYQTLHEVRKRERELTDRLSEQAQRHLQGSEKFEDILMGSNRPTLVNQRYDELFSQGRMEALDAIEGIMQELVGQDSACVLSDRYFSSQLLLEVLKLSYDEASSSLREVHCKWKCCVGIGVKGEEEEESSAVRQLESAVALFLRKTTSKHDVKTITQRVQMQLALKYSESEVFVAACKTEAFSSYLDECAHVCWELSVQTPPMVIDYSCTHFDFDLHTRFFESDVNSDTILLYHWPTLMLNSTTPVSRGHVQT